MAIAAPPLAQMTLDAAKSSVLTEYSPLQQLGPDEFTERFFLELIPYFMESSYPFHPILNEDDIRYSIANMHASREHYAFVHAWAGMAVHLKPQAPTLDEFYKLYSRAIDNRCANIHDMSEISIRRIMTSMWIHNCLNLAKKADLENYYLRDAVFMIHTLRIDEPEMLERRPLSERAALQRLYWELFIHERFFCFNFGEYHSPILPALSRLPIEDPTVPLGVQAGFNQIITLFSLIDDVFLSNWHAVRRGSDSSDLTSAWVEQMNKVFDEELYDESSVDLGILSSMQHADIVVTRQWLRTIVWQMAMSRYLLSSAPNKECMSLLFPVKLVQQLRGAMAGITGAHLRIHGRGICIKLFEVTDTIANVVLHVPATSTEDEAIRVDHFLFLYRFVITMEKLDHELKVVLQDKIDKIQEMFPSIQGAEHLLEAAKMNSH